MKAESRPWEREVSLAYALLRVTIGLNICMHGLVRWTAGLGAFAGSLMVMFQKVPLPGWSVYSFGYVLPVLESIIGAAVLLGFQTRRAVAAGIFLMLALTFGSTLRQDWQTTGLQLIYSFIYAVLLASVRWDRYGVDSLFRAERATL
jgi:thiosulfate dehydrogenase [quinone] large subunit